MHRSIPAARELHRNRICQGAQHSMAGHVVNVHYFRLGTAKACKPAIFIGPKVTLHQHAMLALAVDIKQCFACMQATACNANPCKNGGVCDPVGDANYKCLCAPGFTGTTCEVPLCRHMPPLHNQLDCVVFGWPCRDVTCSISCLDCNF